MTSNSAVGRIDHIGFAVRDIDEARKFWEGCLGATLQSRFTHYSGDFELGIFDLNGFCIELLAPIHPDGFLAEFINKRGEGVHHITLQTPNLVNQCQNLSDKGIKVVDMNLDVEKGGVDAFISPSSSHGVLIQLGENLGPLNTLPYWQKESKSKSHDS